MTLMYLLDNNQDVIEIVPKGLTLELWQEMGINEIDTLHGTMILNPKLKSKIDETFYVGVPDMVDKHSFNLYRLIKKEVTNTEINIQGIQLGFDELASKGYIKDMRPRNETFQSVLSRLLQDSGWSLGFVDDRLPIVNGSFYYMNRLEAIGELINLTGAELKFKVAISNNKITDKYVEAYLQMGSDSGKRFTYGSNSLDIVAEENVAELYTAILGRGRGEEISSADDNASGQAGYGRKIDFAEIEWKKSSGNPVDKPKGQEYVEIPEATEMFGFTDGSPRLLIKDYPNIDDPAQLIQASYRDLLDYSRPKVQFKTKVENVGNLHVGDTVSIIRYDLDLKYQARVFKVKYNRLDLGASEIDLGDALTDSNAKSQAKFRKQVSREIREVDRAIENTYIIASDGTKVNYGAEEPDTKKVNDIWFETLNDGSTRIRVWDGNQWVIEIDTSDTTKNADAIAEQQKEIEEARQVADEAVDEINTAVANAGFTSLDETMNNMRDIADGVKSELDLAIENAGFTSLDETIQNISGIATGVKSELDLAIENAGFTTLDDTLRSMNDITKNAEQNAQQAITDASNAHGLAQTSISEAQTAQANSLSALGKADDALDGVSDLDIRVDEVESELTMKADNTFMTDDGELITLSNAITFNAHRFSSDMQRIESRVESLAGEVNLVILKDAFEDSYLLGGETYPTPTKNSGSVGSDTMREKIKVEPNETLALSKIWVTGVNTWRINFYYNGSYVSRMYTGDYEYILTIPNNVNEIWVSYPRGSKPQIVRGTDFIPYRPNIADQMSSDEVVIFRNEFDEFADRSERRLSAIDSSGGRLETAENLITQTAEGLSLKANRTTVEELTGDVNTISTELQVMSGEISSKVGMLEVEGLIDEIQPLTNLYSGRWESVGSNLQIGYRDEDNWFTVGQSNNYPYQISDEDRLWNPGFRIRTGTSVIISGEIRVTSGTGAVTFGQAHTMSMENQGFRVEANTNWESFGGSYTAINANAFSLYFHNNRWYQIRNLTIHYGGGISKSQMTYVESEIKQTHDSISATISSLDDRVVTQKMTIDGIATSVEGHGGRLTTVETTANGLQSAVYNSDGTSKITQLATGLSSVVSDFNELNTTGWNLMKGSRDYIDIRRHGSNYRTSIQEGVDPYGNQSQLFRYTPLSDRSYLRFDGVILENNVDYTFSAWMKRPNGTGGNYNVRISIGSNIENSKTFTLNDSEWTKVELTGKKRGFEFVHIEVDNRFMEIHIFEPKVEKGSSSTPWLPHPEEVANRSQITQVSNEISLTVSGIDDRVAQQKLTLDGLSTTVSGVDDRVAQQKLTLDGLSTTVSDNDGRLTTVETTANGLQSAVYNSDGSSKITQLSSGLSSVVSDFNALDTTGWNTMRNTRDFVGVRQHGSNYRTVIEEGTDPYGNESPLYKYEPLRHESYLRFDGVILENNVDYTFSAWMKRPNGTGGNYPVRISIGHNTLNSKTFTLNDSEWTKVELTGKRWGYSFVHIEVTSLFMPVHIFEPKVEKGTEATPWLPHPEEVSTQSQITQLSNEINLTISGVDERVAQQKLTLDGISTTVSGHDSRISTVEQTAEGLQSTVADKANQSQVTQLATGLNVLTQSKPINILINGNFASGFTGWTAGENVTFQRMEDVNGVRYARVYNARYDGTTNGEANRFWKGTGMQPNKRYRITFKARAHGDDRAISVGQATDKMDRIVLSTGYRQYEVIYEGISTNAFSVFLHNGGTYEIGNIEIHETTAISSSQISALSDNINLRVTKAGLLSQINIEAGRTLIQSDKLLLDASNVVFTGTAWIPNSVIGDLSADKITSGRLDAGKITVVNLDANSITSNQASFVTAGFNDINSNLTISGSSLTYSHTDGSQTIMNANGLYHRRGGTNYQTHFFNDVVTVNDLNHSGTGKWVTLPSIYKGKDFTAHAVVSDTYGVTNDPAYYNLAMLRVVCFVDQIDKAGGRVRVRGYSFHRDLRNNKTMRKAIQAKVIVSY